MAEGTDRSIAALSVDLDNLWTYLRAFGDERWHDYPDFLSIAVPRMTRMLDELELTATMFVVGRDTEIEPARKALVGLAQSRHEIANHSFDHSLEFSSLSEASMDAELERCEAALRTIGVNSIRGFRAPSFALTEQLLSVLVQRGYRYDSSSLPTSVGPLARAWLRHRSVSQANRRNTSKTLFGGFSAARRTLRPHRLTDASALLELPITTMPVLRLPMHWTYLNHLAGVTSGLANAYLAACLGLLGIFRIRPVLLLHATDFLGHDDKQVPAFLPGMRLGAAAKLKLLKRSLSRYQASHRLVTLGEYANLVA